MSGERAARLDATVTERLRESVGAEFLDELVATFLADAPVQLAALRAAVERNDTEDARRAAHTLKSNGATFGADRFTELCRALEERTKAGTLAGAGALVAQVEDEYASVAVALARLERAAP